MPGISCFSESITASPFALPSMILRCLREHPRHVPDGVEGLGEAHPSPQLVDEVGVGTAFCPHLADDVVGRLGVPEGAVPDLGDVVAVEPEVPSERCDQMGTS